MHKTLHKKQPAHIVLCKPGQLVKVYLNQECYSTECTYGVVIRLNERDAPVIAYKDLSKLKLGQYDKLLLFKDLEFSGDFVVHGEVKKNEPPIYNPESETI